MFKRFHHVYQEEAGGGATGAAAAGADASAAGAAAAAGAGTQGDGAAAAGASAAAATNLLAALGKDGAAASGDQGNAADLTTAVPEQYHVKGADGNLDVTATLVKQAEAYKHLQARMVEHGAPPKTPEEYKVTVPDGIQGWDPDADESVAAFRKDAIGLGLSQKQFDGVVKAYLERIPGMIQQTAEQRQEACKTALGEVWRTPKEMQDNSRAAFRAVTSLLGADAERAMEASGNDPWFLRLAAAVGGEMAEDKAPGQGDGMGAFVGMTPDQLMAHPAYWDSKHVDHARVSTLVRQSFEKQHGTAPVI